MQPASDISNQLDAEKSSSSQESITIGVDIGGTHTDAVLLKGKKIIAVVKVNTTTDVTHGVMAAISELLSRMQLSSQKVDAVMIGTTHFINAVLQAKALNRVLVVRLAKPTSSVVEPLFDWPENLKAEVGTATEIIYGGHEYDGKEITKLDKNRLLELAQYSLLNNIKSAAITGVFSSVNPSHEIEARDLLKSINPNLQITLSHDIGGLNLLLRENATILNAALFDHFAKFYNAIKTAMAELNLNNATLYFSSNDGTLEKPQDILPISTYCSGQSNSIRGAALLTEYTDALLIDIGGTSADVCVLKNKFPLESGYEMKIGNENEGISCSFPAPLTRSYGLGGGSIITIEKDNNIKVGPESVGHASNNMAIIFGGDVLTVTDIAVAKGRLKLGVPSRLNSINTLLINRADELIHKKLAAMVSRMLPFVNCEESIPLILVGGGALLFDKAILLNLLDTRIKEILIPNYAEYANAIGAATAKISGSYSAIFQYTEVPGSFATPRNLAIDIAKQKATESAISKGAKPSSIQIQELEEIPINYLPGNRTKVRVRVVGDMQEIKIDRNKSEENQNSLSNSLQEQISNTSQNKVRHKKELNKELENTKILDQNENQRRKIETLPRLENFTVSREYLLKEEDISNIAVGTGFLGSGGGGSTKMCEIINREMIRKQNTIKMISLDELPNESLVISVGVMGAPTVLVEKLPSKEESLNAISKMEEILKQKIDYVIPFEIGGMNGLYAIYIAALAKKVIIDGDYMGRSFPEIQMVTPNIYGQLGRCIAVLSNGQECHVLQSENLAELEMYARSKTIEMGGIVTLAYLPLYGKEVKKVCIHNSISVSNFIGKKLRDTDNFNMIQALNKNLTNTTYGPAEIVVSGKIIDLHRNFEQGFNKGFALIESDDHTQVLRVDFKNENLKLINIMNNAEIACVPTIITLLDNERKPLSCECLRVGIEVTIVTLQVPEMLRSEKALTIIGPKSFKVNDEINVPTLSSNQRDYILKELAILEGCLAKGLGFESVINKHKNLSQKLDMFIVYPGAEEKAFIEAKRCLNIFDKKNSPFDFDVQWLEMNICKDELPHYKAYIIKQKLVDELLQAEDKCLAFLISIGKDYHEDKKLEATIDIFCSMIESCVTLIKEANGTSQYIKDKNKKHDEFTKKIGGIWHIRILIADTLQAHNQDNYEQAKSKYSDMGREWLFKNKHIFERLKKAAADCISLSIEYIFWDDLLNKAKSYRYQEMYDYLLQEYTKGDPFEKQVSNANVQLHENQKQQKEHLFQIAVLIKGLAHKVRKLEKQIQLSRSKKIAVSSQAIQEIEKRKTDLFLQELKKLYQTIAQGRSEEAKNVSKKEVDTSEGAAANKDIAITKNQIIGFSDPEKIKLHQWNNYWNIKCSVFRLDYYISSNFDNKNKTYNFPGVHIEFAVPRVGLLSKIHSFLNNNEPVHTSHSIILVLQGMSAVGKSHLASYYSYNTKINYGIRVWLKCSSKNELERQLFQLGQQILLFDKDTKLKKGIQLTKDWLLNEDHGHGLLIFDDAIEYEMIKEYIPLNNFQIIITTRHCHWHQNNMNILKVDTMETYEAKELLRKHRQKESENDDKLIEKLGCLPLALEMAANYLRINKHISIDEYLIEYEQNFKELMGSDKLFDKELANASVVVTFRISIKRIISENMKLYSSDRKIICIAEELLNVCAYLSSGNIPFTLLAHWLNGAYREEVDKQDLLIREMSRGVIQNDKTVFDHAINQLLDHSLIKVDFNLKQMSIHVVLQDVIRNYLSVPIDIYIQQVKGDLEKTDKKIRYKSETGKVINYFFSITEHLLEEYANIYEKETMLGYWCKKKLQPHLEIILDQLDELLIRLKSTANKDGKALFDKVQNALLFGILVCLEDVCQIYGVTNKQTKLILRILSIGKLNSDIEGIDRVSWLYRMGIAYTNIGYADAIKELFERLLILVESHYGKEHIATSSALNSLANIVGDLGNVNKKRELLERALSIVDQHYKAEHSEILIMLLTNLGHAYTDLGDYQKSLMYLKRAYEIAERYLEENHIEFIQILTNLANAHGGLGFREIQKDLLEHALRIAEDHYGKHHIEVANTLCNLGGVYSVLGDAHQGKHLLNRALVIVNNHYSKNKRLKIAILSNLGGITYANLANPVKQCKILNKALDLAKSYYGQYNFNLIMILYHLGIAYGVLGDTMLKKDTLEYALSISEKHFGENHIQTAIIKSNLGDAYTDLGKNHLERARSILEAVLPIIKSHYGDDHLEVAVILNNLGKLYIRTEQLDKALECFNRALLIHKHHSSCLNLSLAFLLRNLGSVYLQKENLPKAFEYMLRSLVLCQLMFKRKHPEVAKSLQLLGFASALSNNYNQAYFYMQNAYTIYRNHPRYGVNHPQTKEALSLLIEFDVTDETKEKVNLLSKYIIYDLSQTSGEKCLRKAAANNQADDLAKIIKAGININAQDTYPKSKRTALHWAIKNGCIECATLLIQAGADINIKDAVGKTALQYLTDDIVKLYEHSCVLQSVRQ